MNHISDIRQSFNMSALNTLAPTRAVRSALDPHSTFIKWWHQVLFAGIVYELFIVPFMVTYKPHAAPQLATEMQIMYAWEVLFAFDFLVKLNTSSYDDGSNVHRDIRKARIKYLRSREFVLDVVSILPLSLLPVHIGASPVVLEVLKVLLRLTRLPKYLTNLDDLYAKHFELLKLAKLVVGIALLSHGVACVRFSFGYDTDHTNHWLPRAPASVYDNSSDSHVDSSHSGLSPTRKYLTSLFWAFGILSGLFEGELPHSISEFVFTIIVALCGFTIFTSLCATFFMLSKCESGETEAAEGRIIQLKHILNFHHVPDSLRTQAVEYLRLYYTDADSNEREVMKLLCSSVATDIQIEFLKDTVARVPLFVECDNDAFLVALTSLLERTSLPAQCTLFEAGDYGDAMYIIHAGVLDIFVGNTKVRELRKHDFVGELSLFSTSRRTATVVTTTYCVLYKLSRFYTEKVLDGYPRVAKAIAKAVDKLLAQAHEQKKKANDDDNDSNSRTVEKSAVTMTAPNGPQQLQLRCATESPLVLDAPNAASPTKLRGAAFAAHLSTILQMHKASGYFRKKTSNTVTPIAVVPQSQMIQHDDRKTHSPIATVAATAAGHAQFPLIHRVLTTRKHKASNSIQEFYDQYTHATATTKRDVWWAALLLQQCLDADSTRRLWWLLVLQFVLVENWIVIPVQLAFDLLDDPSWWIHALNGIADVVLYVDIYINLNLSYLHDAEKIWEPTRSAVRYVHSRLALDVICAFPYWIFAPSIHFATMRIPRLFRFWRTLEHYQELDKRVHLHSRQRLVVFGIVLLLLIHVVSCLHFSVTHLEGFNDYNDSWLPCTDVELREVADSLYVDHDNETFVRGDPHVVEIAHMQYARSLYYATNVLTGLGRTMEPDSDTQYVIALVFMVTGFLITAIVVDNVQKRFTASAFDEKQFFAVRSRIQLFLRRQHAPFAIHHRVNSFLDYWWAAHRGAVIGELLVDLPLGYRREILRSVCHPALQTLALLNGVRSVLHDLEVAFVDHAQFVLYGQDEVLYHEGDNAHGLFFLLEGCAVLATTTQANGSQQQQQQQRKDVPHGACFGSRVLQTEGGGGDDDTQTGYAETAVAASGCVVLFFPRAKLERLYSVFPDFGNALLRLEKRLLDTKLSKSAIAGRASSNTSASSSDSHTLLQLICSPNASIDPDSKRIAVWETWLFVAMTLQWVLVIFHICFGVDASHHTLVDATTIALEAFFLIDMYVRTRLGFHEFGNKVMDATQIRRRYFYSRAFAVDLVALLPLFALNWVCWTLPPQRRLEIFNINKLARLLKVPTQFQALEQRYLTFALELRLFKLMYYTFLLAHIVGSLYFDFAAHASQVYTLGTASTEGNATHITTNFGSNKWLLSSELEHADSVRQYFAATFWAFGLMSASQQGELPKSSVQCLFSVATMIAGFFLFAYVVGNFADIIELSGAEHREFTEKLGAMRHLLTHFTTIPPSIATKMKTFFFFKRFHSITQEDLLERCLPPSLVTDIRLLNLQEMIAKVPFLGSMDEAITRMLVSHFSQVLVLQDDDVYRQGDDGSDMYFVFTGVLRVFVLVPIVARGTSNRSGSGAASGRRRASAAPGDSKALQHMSELTAGDFFGENAMFSASPRTAFVRARTSCILYALSRQSLEMVFELYPQWKKRVLQTVKVQQKQQRLNAPTMATVAATDALECTHDDDAMRSARLSVQEATSSSDTSNANDGAAMRPTETGGVSTAPLPNAACNRPVVVTHGVLRFAPAWVRSLVYGVEAQSRLHLLWLQIITASTAYIAAIVPYRLAFDLCDRWTPVAAVVNVIQVLCTALFSLDIYVNWHLRASDASIEIYEESHRDAYTSKRLVCDVLAALPIDYVVAPVVSFDMSCWVALTRCIKVANMAHYMAEVNRQSVLYELERFKMIWVLYLLAMYWSACLFLGVASLDGYGTEWNGWLPTEHVRVTDVSHPSSHELWLRVFRGVFFAVTAFVKKCRTFVPGSTLTAAFSIAISFIGLLGMSFMIGEISSLYISYIGNEVAFRKDQIETELFLSRRRAQLSAAMRARVHAFLSTLWSTHNGVHYQHVLDELLPPTIRRETMLHIADRPLKAWVAAVFQPLLGVVPHGSNSKERRLSSSSNSVLTPLLHTIADALRFESYPRGEVVIVDGTIPKSMYFVIKGQLVATPAAATAPLIPAARSSAAGADIERSRHVVRFKKGSYVGEQGMLAYAVSRVSVRAVKTSELLSLPTDALLQALQTHSYFASALAVVHELVASLRATCASSNEGMPRARDVWATQLHEILDRQRIEWARRVSRDETTAAIRAPRASTAAAVLKGMTLWNTVLADVLDADAPSHACLNMLEPFLELVVPVDERYEKSAAVAVAPKSDVTTTNSNVMSLARMKNVAQQMGVNRLRFKTAVQKLSMNESAMSQRTLNVTSLDT